MNTPETPDLAIPTGFVLRSLHVFNWGPFGGLHHAEFDAWGSALIGATGSGKTTLVDALMTLLVERPSYNLASTGGTESDRSLMSYLRGDSGMGNTTDNRHVARPDKTSTGIAATFVLGEQHVRLAGVFWLEGSGRAAADRKDVWLFEQANSAEALHDLPHWLTLLDAEGARGLKHAARLADGVQVFDSKRAYLAKVQGCFAVGDNAFRLLNRATGLKQLSSIDEIFRELVLDDRSAFERAAQVAQEFDQLVGIRIELERARAQVQSLRPVAALAPRRLEALARIEAAQQLLAALPWWFAQAAQTHWQAECERLQAMIQGLQAQVDDLASQTVRHEDAVALRQAAYAKAGGGDIDTLKSLLAAHQREQAEAARQAAQYQQLMQRLGWMVDLTPAAFESNRQKAATSASTLRESLQKAEQSAYDAGARHSDDARRCRELADEIEKIRQRPGSNIPSHYQDWRADLAAAVGLASEELPFLAELVEVLPAEQRWRGAIERALGGERLRLLVPPAAFAQALQWVNSRHNRGVLVRLLDPKAALAEARERGSQPFEDGYVAKLKLKAHKLAPVAKAVLARRDRHCVDSVQALAQTDHAMTVEGSFSDTGGRHEKDDRRDLREGWLTGFDNRDQLQALAEQLKAAQADAATSLAARDAAIAEHKRQAQEEVLLKGLAELRFEQIDHIGRQRVADEVQARLDALLKPGSSVDVARQALAEAQAALRDVQSQAMQRASELAVQSDRLESAQDKLQDARRRAANAEPDEATLVALRDQLPDLADVPAAQLSMKERDWRDETQATLSTASGQLHDLEKKLVAAMSNAQKVDTGALAQSGTEMADIDAYLTRLHVLESEDLPAKRNRFQSYLNTSSDQGVTQLLTGITQEVDEIEQRIDAINATLARVAFQPGRHLQLVCQRVAAQSVKNLEAAQKQVRVAALKADADEGESHFQALQEVVQQLRHAAANPRTLASRALLDARHRVQFAITVIDTASGQVIERRTGSQGGSGGEKEVIAIYVLTASLSYALCARQAGVLDAADLQPRFATMVLDEAFSRTSQAVAARIVAALRAFGLNPLFVTPNKELRLLREHTRRAILVHREGAQARLASMGWAEIEARAGGQMSR
ncbi:ATP-binding protein [Ottowia sp. SB7-C50]|uniref:ATP-binding protein n=1 Tax=Ottowia sp. SB7-C50 TaxID=3081231 RepID=UPI0029546EF4|nr:ATP-binding protein [Ottowia sp. SB7-C50]WOP14192.1 ATP-binding protein [Ottowia sp. SB7-C50]